MIDIEKEYEGLKKKLNRYKKRQLGFECGCVCGVVIDIKLVDDDQREWYEIGKKAIQIIGRAGFQKEGEEHVLFTIREEMIKGKDFKYWWKYHIFEIPPM